MALQPAGGGAGGTSSHCQLHCDGRFSSTIVFQPEKDPNCPNACEAGLCDRAHALSQLMLLSNALCAKLEVWPPWRMLAGSHNGDEAVGRDVWWDRYFSDIGHLLARNLLPVEVTIGPSRTEEEAIEHFAVANFSRYEEGTAPFVWGISTAKGLNVLEKRMGRRGNEWARCGMRRTPWLPGEAAFWSGGPWLRPSPLVRRTAESAKAELNGADPATRRSLYDTLHVRRGDTLDDDGCDTSPAAILEYMGKEGQTPYDRPRSLLLFSDETDEEYLGTILDGLARLPRWDGAVRHGDRLITTHLAPQYRDDNYLVYAAGGLLMADGALHFVFDRSRDCNPHKNSSFPLRKDRRNPSDRQ